jgi:hypothetical protein
MSQNNQVIGSPLLRYVLLRNLRDNIYIGDSYIVTPLNRDKDKISKRLKETFIYERNIDSLHPNKMRSLNPFHI